MKPHTPPPPVHATDLPIRTPNTGYPPPFAARMTGRDRRVLGDVFGLDDFGVNHVTMAPGTSSALRHWHTLEDEFIYVLEGEVMLHTDGGLTRLTAGMCAGFKAGEANGHRLVNASSAPASYLEVGARKPADECRYPDDDLDGVVADGQWRFQHKDGRPY